METRPYRFSVKALQGVIALMYETRKTGCDSSDVFNTTAPTNTPELNESQGVYHTGENDWAENDWYGDCDEWEANFGEEVSEVVLEDGAIMLVESKKPTKPRKTPGIHEASRRGAAGTFSHIPGKKEEGGVCIRCGGPSYH